MSQQVDVNFKDEVKSTPINTRFGDITGACVLRGFRLKKGSAPFTVNLERDGYTTSAAVTPSGARVTESADLQNVLSVNFNSNPSDIRIDSVYAVYTYGAESATVSYTIVEGVAGSGSAPTNPNPATHLLLGTINVPPNNVDVQNNSFVSVPYGFAKLDVAGPSNFHGIADFRKPVIFHDAVTFSDGSSGGGGSGGSGDAAMMDRLSNPIIAAPGQTIITLPSEYVPNTKTLFVFADWVLQPPNMYLEASPTSFSFYSPLSGGEKIWAFWIKNVNLFSMIPHDHNDLYYTKQEIADRGVKTFFNTFNGMSGRVLTHNLNSTGYIVNHPVPTNKTSDVGDVSVVKDLNTITVYNTGSYRGPFELTYFRTL